MTDLPVLVSEQYYRKTFIGKGATPKGEIDAPKLGYFYIDATTGEVYAYDGAAWNKITGATVCVTV